MKKIKKMKKIILTGCAISLLLSGCGGGEKASKSNLDFKGYPIQTEETLTYWCSLNSAISTIADNAGKTDYAKALKEKTGVSIEYSHPAAGQEGTALSLMIASDQLPDMIETDWSNYAGGPTKSIDEGIIYPLNDYLDQAPNLKKFLEENPEIDKMVKTDDGTYYAFPFIREDKRLLISVGTLIRTDWLEELGLKEPETIAEMETVLKAFKDKKGATAPLSFKASDRSKFLGNFSTSAGFYLEDGKIVYGPLTEKYKTALETMKRWYDEGLLDPNFVSVDSAGLTANVLNGKTGITVNTGGGGLGTWLDNMKGKDFDMSGMAYTKPSADEEVTYYQVETNYPGYGSVAITTACKNPELAVRWLDYGYSEEGYVLNNFGTEGVSFEKKGEEYVYTDLIFNNPDGLTMAQAMANNFRSSSSGPFVQSKNYINQFYYRPQQQKALDSWLKNYDKVKENSLPNTSKTEDEAKEYSSIMAEISKYEAKMFTNFVLGTNSLDEYDKFVEEIKGLNIDRAIEIQEAALERFNNR